MAGRKRLKAKRPEAFTSLRWDMNRDNEYRMAVIGFVVSLAIPVALFIAPFLFR